MRLLLLLSVLLGGGLHGALVSTEKVLFQENFNLPASLNRWQVIGCQPKFLPGGAPNGQGNAIRFSLESDGDSKISLPLDPKKISGLISFE